MQVLPYNRVVQDLAGLSPNAFLEAVRERFEMEAGPAQPVRRGEGAGRCAIRIKTSFYESRGRRSDPSVGNNAGRRLRPSVRRVSCGRMPFCERSTGDGGHRHATWIRILRNRHGRVDKGDRDDMGTCLGIKQDIQVPIAGVEIIDDFRADSATAATCRRRCSTCSRRRLITGLRPRGPNERSGMSG